MQDGVLLRCVWNSTDETNIELIRDRKPMVMPRQGPTRLPFPHYAMIYMDNMGKVRVEESPSIRDGPQPFFTPELQQKFVEVVRAKMNYQRSILGSM
mgnify:CR=1 FL=1